MSERILFRSLYSKIAVGFVAVLAALLLAQTLLFLWLTDSFSRNAVKNSPAQLAATAAADISLELTAHPRLDVDRYLREEYGRVYQPFAVVLRDGRTGSNRRTALPAGLIRETQIRLERGFLSSEEAFRPRGGEERFRARFPRA